MTFCYDVHKPRIQVLSAFSYINTVKKCIDTVCDQNFFKSRIDFCIGYSTPFCP